MLALHLPQLRVHSTVNERPMKGSSSAGKGQRATQPWCNRGTDHSSWYRTCFELRVVSCGPSVACYISLWNNWCSLLEETRQILESSHKLPASALRYASI